MRLLVAEDEKDIAKALVTLLQKNNYCADSVNNGTDALEYVLTGNYDGVILDIMMPGMSGIEVLKKLREKGSDIPVLMLTAKGELYDKVEGLDAGADDYLAKPFAIPELMARVMAMLRRRADFKPDILSVKDVDLNRSTMEIEHGTSSAKLSTRECGLPRKTQKIDTQNAKIPLISLKIKGILTIFQRSVCQAQYHHNIQAYHCTLSYDNKL